MQFTKESINNLQRLLKRSVITTLTKLNGCVYVFGGAITDSIFCLKTPVIKIFSFNDFSLSETNFKWEEIKYKDLFGESKNTICWKCIDNDITYLLYTKNSIKNTLHKEIVTPDDILSLCNFNYEMIYIPTSTTEIHGANEYMLFMGRKLISLCNNKKLETSLVNIAIKASKRYKIQFDNKLAREVSQFCKSIKIT